MSWVYLFIAGLFEIVWAVGLKYCDSLKFNAPVIIVITSMALSVLFLGLATQKIPISTSYAAWTGMGIVGVSIYSAIVFKQPVTFSNLLFITLILTGVIGLKLQSTA